MTTWTHVFREYLHAKPKPETDNDYTHTDIDCKFWRPLSDFKLVWRIRILLFMLMRIRIRILVIQYEKRKNFLQNFNIFFLNPKKTVMFTLHLSLQMTMMRRLADFVAEFLRYVMLTLVLKFYFLRKAL